MEAKIDPRALVVFFPCYGASADKFAHFFSGMQSAHEFNTYALADPIDAGNESKAFSQ